MLGCTKHQYHIFLSNDQTVFVIGENNHAEQLLYLQLLSIQQNVFQALRKHAVHFRANYFSRSVEFDDLFALVSFFKMLKKSFSSDCTVAEFLRLRELLLFFKSSKFV